MSVTVELFETFDDDGRPRGLVPRNEVHRRGLWHRASNVFLFDGGGRLYLQRRASRKDVWPNAWDLSVGEHLQPGETFEQAAHRGLAEELAVRGVALTPIGDVVRGCIEIPELQIRDFELQQTFRGVYDGPIAADPAEVSDVRLTTLVALARSVAATPDDFTPWLRSRLRALGPRLCAFGQT
ncbi:MAG TPA: NUDIX domain-containing protein [Pseudomonadales bacterium]|nr:NUDIX domain-containing protein [Pseudomonadales bacterium]